MKLHCIIALLLLFWLSPGLLNGQLPYAGVVITKQGQLDKDIHATATPFTGMQTVGPITSFGLTTGGRVNIPNGQIVQIVSFGDAQFRDLSTPAEADYFKALSASFAKVISQYPKSQPYLQPVQAVIAADLQRYAAGEVRINNAWISAEQAAAMAKERQDRQLAQMRAADEARALEQARMESAQKMDAQKRSNLHAPFKSSGAEALVAIFKGYLEKPEKNVLRQEKVVAYLPTEAGQLEGGIELPDYNGYRVTLFDGADSTSMACLTMSDDNGIKRVIAVLPMRIKEDKCINRDQAKVFKDFVTKVDVDVGLWVPVGLATARTKLQAFGRGAAAELTEVFNEFEGKGCSLLLSRPYELDDGTAEYHVVLYID